MPRYLRPSIIALFVSAYVLVAAVAVGQSVGTALVNGAPQIQGTVDGNLQQMTGANVVLNSGAVVTGDLFVPGTPSVISNGNPIFGGIIVGSGNTSPSNYQIILNSGARLGHLRTRTNAVALPTVPSVPAPSGTRSVTITAAGQSAGNFATLRNLTLNGNVGQYAIPAGTYGDFIANAGSGFTLGVAGATQPAIYNFQHLTLNGATRIDLLGPVTINVANGFTGNGAMGTSTNPAWLQLKITSGGFTLNGGCTMYGYVTAPNGTIIINGSSTLTGGAISAGLTVNSNGLLKLFDIASFQNHPPVAASQSVTTTEDTAKQIVLSATDVDGQTLTYSVVSQPAHGVLSGTPPQLTYTPTHGYFGSDSFTFKANDGQVDSNVATVSITITHVNHSPTANSQTITLNQDTSRSVTLTGSDPDNDALMFRVTTSPAHGSLSGTPPNLTYTPAQNFYGADSFAFVANDGAVDSAPATVSITVNHVNHPPVANGQNVQTNEDTALSILLNATDVDSDPLSYTVLTSPTHGSLSGTAPNLTYTPAAHFHGIDSFTFKANDGSASSNAATVQITVVHVNHPPVAAGQSVQTNEDTAVLIVLSATDADSDPLTYTVLTSPAHGALSGTAPNLTYAPTSHFFGSDSFTFQASDGSANSNTATVQITVVHVNHPPVANGQNVLLDEDTTAAITLTGSDPDGDSITFSISVQPQHGTLSGTPPSVVYHPVPDYFGSDSFTFRTNDGTTSSPDGFVNLTVRSINDPPTVQISTPADGAQFDFGEVIHISASAADIDGTIATLRILVDGAQVFEGQQATAAYDLIDVPAGNHTLVATAIDNDSANGTSAAVAIIVNAQSNGSVQVNAGPDRLISLPSAAHLEGSVTVNGEPAGTNVQLAWQKLSGPGNATFDNSSTLNPTVTFSAAGTYVLKLVATAPEGSSFDTAKVTVLEQPQAGPDSPVSNQGREFWMAYLSNPTFFEPTYSVGNLNISSEIAATGTVEIFDSIQTDGQWQVYRSVKTFSVVAGGKTVVDVTSGPPDYRNQYDQARYTSVHIVADGPIAVHALNVLNATTDGSLILPTSLLGLDHYIMSYRNTFTSARLGSECAIVATKVQTSVTITPTAPTGSHPAGQPFTVMLQVGEVYRLISLHDGEDLTGTRIQADKPVAVYGGHSQAYVPYGVPFADHLYEQMPPVDLWGRHFVTVPFKGRTGGDLFRLLASNDNTHVSINGEIVATLNGGQFYERVLTQPASIVADQRILVGQLAQGTNVDHTTGDPFLSLVPPYETFGRHYIMPTPYFRNYDQAHHGYVVSDIYDSYLTLIVDSAHAADVRVNGQPVDSAEFFPIADTNFSGASIHVPKNSTQDISSLTPIGTMLYGWAPFESYGFTGGLYGAIDSATAQLTLTQSASAAPVGSSHRVRAQLVNSAGLTVPDAQVNFSVTGANPINGTGFTAPDGSVEFSWQGSLPGVDAITATSGTLSAATNVTWVAAGANQPPQVNAGPDVLVKLGEPLPLHGVVQDDGLPAGGQLSLQWSTLPGPGDVTFANPTSADTTANFLYPGQYRLRLTAYDGQFAGEDDLNVTVDIAPVFIELHPSAEVVGVGADWNIGVSAEDQDGIITTIDLIDGNQVLATLFPNEQRVSYYYTVLSTVFTATGPHSLVVRLTDNQGATTDSSLVVNVRAVPIVQILTPPDGTTIAAGESITFTASATSSEGSITRVVYKDVTDYEIELGDGTGTDYQFVWTPNYSGTRLIAATAYDSDGIPGTSDPINVTIQSPGDPTVTFTSPQDGISVYPGETVSILAEASAFPPAQVYEVDFAADSTYLGARFYPPFEAQWSSYAVGPHTLTAYVYDTFGGFGTSSVTVNVIPVPGLNVTITQPAPNIPIKVNTPTTLSATVDGVLGTLDNVYFIVNNNEQIGDGTSSSVTWTPTSVGTYEITVYAYSSNPYQEGSQYVNVTVADLHSPVVQFSAPENNSSFAPGTPIGLQAQASDVDSNLANLQFLADGALLSETPLSGAAGVASFTWDNADPGWHSLTAMAIDDTIQSGSAILRVFVQRALANDLIPPSELTSEATSSSSIHLTWTPSTSPSSVGTAIERRVGLNGAWEEVATVEEALSSYDDTSLQSESYYTYRVAALNDAGARSNYSAESFATTFVQMPRYAVIDLGESLAQSPPHRPLRRSANHPTPTEGVLDLRDAEVMSIDEENNVLLHQSATTSNGQTTIEYYYLWHPNGTSDAIGDPAFRAFRLSRGGVVAGAMDHSTTGQPGVPDSIYHGLEFWSAVGSRPGVFRDDGTRIDVRAAIWTPGTGVTEISDPNERLYRYDRLDQNPPRMLPQGFDSLFSAWDVSSDGLVVGTGSWSDLRDVPPSTPLDIYPTYAPFTFQHGMRWRTDQWDTIGSLRRNLFPEGESSITSVNPSGTIAVGSSAAPDRAGDPPSPTHAMRSVKAFAGTGTNPGDSFLQDLAPLGDGSYAWALDTDQDGGAVGYSTKNQTDPISRTHGVWWGPSSTQPIELPDLGGRVPGVYPEGFGYANAINLAGDRITGKSLTANLSTAGALWALNLNHGGDGRWWEAHDLNEHIPSGWYVVNAIDINNNGLIVGIAYHTVPDPANPDGPPLQIRRSVLLLPLEVTITKPYQGQTFPLCTDVALETSITGPDIVHIDRIEYWSNGLKIAESTDPTNWAAIWNRPPVGVRVPRTPQDIRDRLPFNENCFAWSVVARAITVFGSIESKPVAIRIVPISSRMREFIEVHEIDDDKRGRAGRPEWPEGGSGVTIGIGYDLGMNNPDQIRRDWGPLLPPDVVDRLVAVAPFTGAAAQTRLRDVQDITIPWEAIRSVYENSTIPRFTNEMLNSFPDAANLDPNITGALVSLAFNRGPGLQDRRGQRPRFHMRQIRQALADGNVSEVPSILRDMKSIWDGSNIQNSMYNRREDEAREIERALRDSDGDPCN